MSLIRLLIEAPFYCYIYFSEINMNTGKKGRIDGFILFSIQVIVTQSFLLD